MEIQETILNQLKRNYIKDPLKYGECPLYEDLYFLFITCNMTYDEISPYLNNMKPCSVRSRLKKLGIQKPINLKVECIKRKTFEKYGDTSYSRLQECKNKVKETCRKHYGVDNPNKCREVREKIEKTNEIRYGDKVVSKTQQIKNKVKQTCEQRYGKSSYFETQEFKDKSKETHLKRYNVEHIMQSEEFKNKIKQTNIIRYGVPYGLMSDDIIQKSKQTCLQKWGTSNISTKHIDPKILELINNKETLWNYINKFEIKDIRQIANILGISYDGLKKKLQELDLWDSIPHNICYAENELKVLFPSFQKTRSIIPPQEIDLYNDSYKLGIEYNGIYWHSELFKDKNYHQRKSKLCLDNDVFLYHIFEHEWLDTRKQLIIISQLNNLMKNNKFKVGARKCTIKELDNKITQEFLEKNHLQGRDQSSIRIGLFFENNLISIMTFCKPRFNNNFEWELSRFCNRLDTSVIGAASKLFNYFIDKYLPNNIISYSNFSKTKGNLYSMLGFSCQGLSQPSYIWFKGLKILSRYQCQKHLLNDYLEYGNTEDEIMHNRGYLKCYDCGSFIWHWYK